MTQAPQSFRTYTLHGELARGGQGVIYKALHSSGTPIALKLLLEGDREALKRFGQEARVLSRLNHPNVLRVYEYGEQDGTPFMALEFIQGGDLKAFVAEHGVPPLDWTARVIATLGYTLEHCHGLGVIHRDVKPANVLIQQPAGRPVLVDFGLVKRDPHLLHLQSLDRQSMITQNQAIKGTPDFMAPEQVNTKDFGEISARTDVYGLGATLYYLLTGAPPFEGKAAVVVMRKVTRKAPTDPRERNPQVPAPVAELCLQALAKQPGERPASPHEFAARLAQAAGVDVPVPEPYEQRETASGTHRLSASASGAHRLAPSDSGRVDSRASSTINLPKALPQPGEQLAGCTLERELARGGGGAVYVALAPDGTKRAIKVLLGDMEQEDKRERFAREADVGHELKHPGIVRVFGHGVERGMAYLVMEFLDNARPLDDYCEQEQLSVAGKIQLMEQVADAVQAAHEVGLIHRDLKPDNVLVLADGVVKVVDFGIARHVDKERLTMSGAMLGTLHYMSPEQVLGNGASADARTDVYAMGVMLYQLIRGELPFTGGTGIEVMASIMTDTPPDPCAGVEAPAGLAQVIAMAMAREEDKRYPTAIAFGRDLAATTSGSGNVAAVSVARSRSRTRLALTLLVAVAALVVAVVAGIVAVKQASHLSDDSLSQRVGRVHSEVWKALTEAKTMPLIGEADRIAALRAELSEVLRRRPDATASERVVRAEQRLVAAEGLLALAAGDVDAAKASASSLSEADAPSATALAAALDAVTKKGDPDATARALGRAMTRGIDRLELRAWRVDTRLREGITNAATAEEVLADLDEIERRRALEPDERCARAWAYLALVRIDDAVAALKDVESPPPELRWDMALIQLTDIVEKNPPAAEALIDTLPPIDSPRPLSLTLSQRAFALALVLAQKPQLLRNDEEPHKDGFLRLARLLRIGRKLNPLATISDELADAAVEHATRYSASGTGGERELCLALCALRPDDSRIHSLVSSLIPRIYSDASILELLPIAERAVELERDGTKRLELRVRLIRAQARLCETSPERIDECIRGAATLLEQTQGRRKGWVLASRAWAHFHAKEYAEAIADIDEAISLNNESRFVYRRALILAEAKTRPEQAALDARDFLVTQETGALRCELATIVAWDLGLQTGRLDVAQRTIELNLNLRPYLPGWWVRLAWLHVEVDSDREAALDCLNKAIEWFSPNTPGRSSSSKLHARTSEVAALYSGDDLPKADAALKAFVDQLERLRKRNVEARCRFP